MTALATYTEPARWQPPTYNQPLPLTERSLRQLGTLPDYRGQPRAWYSWTDGEIEALDAVVSAEHAPDGPCLVETAEDGTRSYRVVRLHPPGTFARLTAGVQPKDAKAPAKPRPADALAGLGLLRLHRGTAAGLAEVRSVRGAEAILRVLERYGSVELIGDNVVHRPNGGRRHVGVDEVLARAWPLLLPYLTTGEAPACAFGCGRPAVTTAIAFPKSIVWCRECDGTRREEARDAA